MVPRWSWQRAVPAIVGLVLLMRSTDCCAEAAIAFSQESNGSWQFGTAYDYRTLTEATDAAVQRCTQQGSRCRIVTSFNNLCAGLAVQVGGNGFSVRTNSDQKQANRDALASCTAMGLHCTIQASFCDSVKEIVRTIICTQPVFAEERKLHTKIDGTPQRTEEVAAAINYLRAKYCRETEETLRSDREMNVGDNCYQYSGFFRGERVYWGQCLE
jgi:hypothetical protein